MFKGTQNRLQNSQEERNCVEESTVKEVIKGSIERGGWTRVHKKLRMSKFTPMKIAQGPRSVEEVGEWRLTFMKAEGDSKWKYSVEDWRRLENPHKVVRPFRGFSAFVDKEFIPKELLSTC